MYCSACGKEIADGSKFCKFCGTEISTITPQQDQSSTESVPKYTQPINVPVQQVPQPGYVQPTNVQTQQTVPPEQSRSQVNVVVGNATPVIQKNGLGTAGFVLALIGVFLFWVPVLGWSIWFLGVIFSFIGLFGTPKGMAIAGFIISFIDLIFLLMVLGGLTFLGLTTA